MRLACSVSDTEPGVEARAQLNPGLQLTFWVRDTGQGQAPEGWRRRVLLAAHCWPAQRKATLEMGLAVFKRALRGETDTLARWHMTLEG